MKMSLNISVLSTVAMVGFCNLASATINCLNTSIPLTVTAMSYTVSFSPFTNNSEAMALMNQLVKRDSTFNPFAGTENLTESFVISARYCTPSTTTTARTVQILTHGLGFDKTYWDFEAVAGAYSYVNAALAAGYATFAYDRIGSGNSTYPDPYNIVQGPKELAVLNQLITMLRAGRIPGVPTFSKYVSVGHSYGSSLNNALAATYPAAADSIILTGYSNNFSFLDPIIATTGHLASTNQPRFAGYSSGYLTWGDEYYSQFDFFAFPYFDANVLAATEANKDAFAIGQLLTLPVLPYSAPSYTGPVLYLAAQYDPIFCGGDCNGIVNAPSTTSQSEFPATSVFEAYVHPNSGHCINLHYNATGAYAVVNGFLAAHGF